MKSYRRLLLAGWALLLGANVSRADVAVAVAHNDNSHATNSFTFEKVASPAPASACLKAAFSIVSGERDDNGADLSALNDGKLPSEADEPAGNFFFNAGTDGGRLLADLGSAIAIKQIDTYSWHPGTRAPQVYKLYASDGADKSFVAGPKTGTDPVTVGWKLLAAVDTRPRDGEVGGQYGVAVADAQGAAIGKFRYVLFDISKTEADDDFGNTFFSEISLVGANPATPATSSTSVKTIVIDGGKFEAVLDTTDTPNLTDWAQTQLALVVEEWYPKIVKMLPSDGFDAPRKFSITFHKDMNGVAYTTGTQIHGADKWFASNLKGEAKGAIVHEMVHVVQQYGQARRRDSRPPGWLVEGIPDYIRWYQFESDSHGADLTARGLIRAHFDGSYRVSANFLNYVRGKYDPDLIQKLNAALRSGNYNSDLWKTLTGKSVDELNDEWKENLQKKP